MGRIAFFAAHTDNTGLPDHRQDLFFCHLRIMTSDKTRFFMNFSGTFNDDRVKINIFYNACHGRMHIGRNITVSLGDECSGTYPFSAFHNRFRMQPMVKEQRKTQVSVCITILCRFAGGQFFISRRMDPAAECQNSHEILLLLK